MASTKEKSKGKATGSDPKVIVFAALVIVAALAAIGYYGGLFGAPESPPAHTPILPLATPEARLLLASFDKGAALQDYSMEYAENDNGIMTNYIVASNGTNSYVSVQDSASRIMGFFGANNTTDVVCLEYEDEKKCTMMSVDEKITDAAIRLKTRLFDRKTYMEQKDATQSLIGVGAIQIPSGIVEERVGPFKTQKISYTLDYRNLTVRQLVSLGISPNDGAWKVVRNTIFWIDEESGLIVRSRMSEVNGMGFYEAEYTNITLNNVKVPEKNMTLVGTKAFVNFYTQSQEDYAKKATCLSLLGDERDLCFRNNAVEKRSWEACKSIGSQQIYESCSLIVAQLTKNHVICGGLEALSDECYISVVGETGNAELCKNLKNDSLSSSCAQAAADGKRKADEAAAIAARAYANRNCASDPDCGVFGTMGQYCAPKNSTTQFANDLNPRYTCLEGIPCSCLEGYCGFTKNETYYSCVSDIEEEELREYIRSLIPDNSTAQNSTGN